MYTVSGFHGRLSERGTRGARRPRARGGGRRGMTLMELLIVVAVMAILVGMAIPLMRTGLEDRKLREAARQLNTYVALAQAHAAETGRPAGIWLNTLTLPPGNVSVVGEVFLAETPPPYAGDTTTATAAVSYNGSVWTASDPNSGNISSLVHVGDLIKFNYRGPLYTITSVSGTAVNFSGSPSPPTGSFPYQIYRQPAKSSSMPLEFPSGAVIDLENSGYGYSGTEFATVTSAIAIMFQPDGRVERVFTSTSTTVPSDTIHLLLGKVEQAGNDNLKDNASLWVSIGHQTGRVTTAENAWDAGTPTVATAREYAQSGQMMGGR